MKKGSALLIVLGMMAFIVASAVAFSAYMRHSRLPSGYLRRTSATRLLAKAALAEAINYIDVSIGNDRYPGYSCAGITGDGPRQRKNYRNLSDRKNRDNVVDYWEGRFYVGSEQLSNAYREETDDEGESYKVPETVSVLTVEGLAYVPPALINDARYYARRSAGAHWHTMGFDSGRFAFFAIDVSDFFDVNRVFCCPSDITGKRNSGDWLYGRNSSDGGRITLSYVFETHSGNSSAESSQCTPERWDEFMAEYLQANALPIVSLADLNLAMHAKGMPAFMSPFCNHFAQGGGAAFVPSQTGPQADIVRNMNFITDSWYPVTNRTATYAIDLSRAADQPFYGMERGQTVDSIISGLDSRFFHNLMEKGSPLVQMGEAVQLYDYLDEDHVPVSLALPTVERTPMITGLGLHGNLALEVQQQEKEPKVDPNNENIRYITTVYKMTLHVDNVDVVTGAVYPFKDDHKITDNYELEAAMTIALTPAVSVENTDGMLRCPAAKAPGVVTLVNGSWSDVPNSWRSDAYEGDRPSVVRCRKKGSSLAPKPDVKTEKDAVYTDTRISFGSANIEFSSDLPADGNYDADRCSFRTCRREKKDPDSGQWLPDNTFQDTATAERLGFQPVTTDLSGPVPASQLENLTFVPTVQVWVRLSKGNDTVDLVPACINDDKGMAGTTAPWLDDASGSKPFPLLRFRAKNLEAAGVKIEKTALKQEIRDPIELYPAAYVTDDPRFNYAPENFEAIGELGASIGDTWLTKAQATARGRDGDIFMATSDAGYLQSVYELAHIQQISIEGDRFGAAGGGGYRGKAGTMPAGRAQWRTYSQYNDGSGDYGYLDELDVINGSRGFRVSPYAQSSEITMAALANTPMDWWAASTNETVNGIVHDSASKAHEYSFSDHAGAKRKMPYDALEDIADRMRSQFRRNGASDWTHEFDNLGWRGSTAAAGSEDNSTSLCGVDLGSTNLKLHSVDRKFLHGFWKECFANRQQLFLIFIRAEPMMMGGGTFGLTPPQLGARGVALVWRDPKKETEDIQGGGTGSADARQSRPHRTRVLFYRQFE